MERVASQLNTPFEKLSDSRFKSPDGSKRLIGLCSKSYSAEGETASYWFGFKDAQKEFLTFEGASWLALECEAPQRLLLIPFPEFLPWLESLDRTENKHWHVRLCRQDEQVSLKLSRLNDTVDISTYLL